MSEEFDVVTEELRAAAADIRHAAGGVAGWTMSSSGASASSFGHDQLAQVYLSLCERLSEAVAAQADGLTQVAGGLDRAAATYDSTDAGASSTLGRFAGPGTGPVR